MSNALDAVSLAVANNNWHISLRFDSDVLKQGMAPSSFIKYLNKIGYIASISVLTDSIPSLEEIDSESCYLGFEISFESDKTKEEIESVFEFVREDCAIRIAPPHSDIGRYVDLIHELPEEDKLLGEILLKSSVVTNKELNSALYIQKLKSEAGQEEVLGDILVQQGAVDSRVVNAAIGKQKTARRKQQTEQSIAAINQDNLVSSDNLDELCNMLEALVNASAIASVLVEKSTDCELQKASLLVDELANNIRNKTLSLCKLSKV